MSKDLIKHSINFLEYPLWFQDERLAEISKEGMTWKDLNGYVYRAGYKPPVKTDAIFLLYLLLQSQRNEYAETLTLSRHQILKECGFDGAANWYARLEDSLERWKMVGIKFEGTFYDGKEYRVMSFGVLDGWEIRKEDKLLKVWFSPRFIEMMRGNGFFKFIKFSEFKQLRSSLATRLYEILSKSFYTSDIFDIEAVKLAEKIPMKERYPAHIIPKIQAAILRINKSTTSNFEFSTRPSETEKRKMILCFRKLPEMASIPKPLSVTKPKTEMSFPEEVKTLITLLPPERQNQRSVLETVVGFFEKHGMAYVARNIAYSKKHATHNFRPYLLKALRADYGLAMEEDEEAQREAAAQASRRIDETAKKQAEEIRRRKVEQETQKRAQDYISSLPVDELAALEREAIDGMESRIRDTVLNDGMGKKILLSLAMEQIATRRLEAAKTQEKPIFTSEVTE